jgi:hypothetical protein
MESLLCVQLKHCGGQSHLMVECHPLLGHMCACSLARWPVWPQIPHYLCQNNSDRPEYWSQRLDTVLRSSLQPPVFTCTVFHTDVL